MNPRLELILKAIVFFKEDEANGTPNDENLLVDFIKHQIKLIKQGK